MEESSSSVTREPVPPAPPRWKGTQSLDLVHQLNERCVELLCEVANGTDPDTTLSIVTENRELWARLGPEQRHSVARMLFVIVDADFKNAAWWRRVLKGVNAEAQLSLGMSSSVADLIAVPTPRQIRVVATHKSNVIHFRWAEDLVFGRDFLLAARAGNQKRLAALHHAKLSLCSELAQL